MSRMGKAGSGKKERSKTDQKTGRKCMGKFEEKKGGRKTGGFFFLGHIRGKEGKSGFSEGKERREKKNRLCTSSKGVLGSCEEGKKKGK